MNTGERRSHPRLVLRHTYARNALLKGRVLNVSLGGLALESLSGLGTGPLHRLRVTLRDRPFDLEAEVRWCRLTQTITRRPGEVAAIYRAGFAFSRPLELFSERGLQNSGEWFDPELRVPR